MDVEFNRRVNQVYGRCQKAAGDLWPAVLDGLAAIGDWRGLEDYLRGPDAPQGVPAWLADLAWAECAAAEAAEAAPPAEVSEVAVNPSLHLKQVAWQGLERFFGLEASQAQPEPGEAWLMVWQDPATGQVAMRSADELDLLAVKATVEGLGRADMAMAGQAGITRWRAAQERARARGILLAPRSRIVRVAPQATGQPDQDRQWLEAEVFTLQWHLTQQCDLSCKHCYDRSDRPDMAYDDALAVLQDFEDFCGQRRVAGQVTFTGGNPLLYPRFNDLYAEAAGRGFGLAILGNPTPRARMEPILEIAKPVFFQVSLEGLAQHNDHIRGKGHFARTTKFLALLDKLGIESQVMLTLTAANMDQVIPLGELLRGKTGELNFNRLSLVGQGAALALPDPQDYAKFLEDYLDAARVNPVLHLKDNLLNILRHGRGEPLFGGCTGFGCGAAFNFLALLSDGQVHACRKFPSYLGNAFEQSLADIYDSELAGKYRAGPRACDGCDLRPACGGCLAITHSFGRDIFTDRDPFCFIDR